MRLELTVIKTVQKLVMLSLGSQEMSHLTFRQVLNLQRYRKKFVNRFQFQNVTKLQFTVSLSRQRGG